MILACVIFSIFSLVPSKHILVEMMDKDGELADTKGLDYTDFTEDSKEEDENPSCDSIRHKK